MKTLDWLKQSKEQLVEAGVGTAGLDAQILLSDCLNISRAQLLAHPELELSHEQLQKLNLQIKRRTKHEPLAYIRGKQEFCREEFCIDERVLVPRPETEAMLDELKKLNPKVIFDVGTGSGAIATIAKKLFPSKEVIAIDNDPQCLEVAKKNAKKHGAVIAFQQNNLLEGLAIPVKAVVLANLPYVPDDFAINRAARNEPKQAIFGGPDGLQLYRDMFSQFEQSSNKPEYVLTESLPTQHTELSSIAQKHGYKLKTSNDFIQVFQLLH